MKFMRYQNFFSKQLILNCLCDDIIKKIILEKCYFAISVTSNRDFGKFLKIISQRDLVKLQTDTVFAESLRNSYDELLISGMFSP